VNAPFLGSRDDLVFLSLVELVSAMAVVDDSLEERVDVELVATLTLLEGVVPALAVAVVFVVDVLLTVSS